MSLVTPFVYPTLTSIIRERAPGEHDYNPSCGAIRHAQLALHVMTHLSQRRMPFVSSSCPKVDRACTRGISLGNCTNVNSSPSIRDNVSNFAFQRDPNTRYISI